jgi:hypothetical protein
VIASWTITGADGATGEELLVAFDQVRPVRVLVCPAWFDEANKLRRFTVEVMRRLDKAGIDSFLPDLPGCNDSLAPLEVQTLAGWKAGMTSAAHFFRATHVLAIRAGALLAPTHIPGWHYAPQSGNKLLRGMVRARTIAAREAGRDFAEELSLYLVHGLLHLAGYDDLAPARKRRMRLAERRALQLLRQQAAIPAFQATSRPRR